MKQFAIPVLAAGLAFGVAACQSNYGAEETSAQAAVNPQIETVVYDVTGMT